MWVNPLWRTTCSCLASTARKSSPSKVLTPTRSLALPCAADNSACCRKYLQTVQSAVVDIGASNVEDLLGLMRRYRGSHEDFDYYVVPTVSALKQQDTIATLVELSRLGVPPSRMRMVFNMVEDGTEVAQAFYILLDFVGEHPIAQANPACYLGLNEVYGRVRGSGVDLATLARDATDYKALIVNAKDTAEKVALAQKLANRRLASGVVPELDACFAALDLRAGESHNGTPMQRQVT